MHGVAMKHILVRQCHRHEQITVMALIDDIMQTSEVSSDRCRSSGFQRHGRLSAPVVVSAFYKDIVLRFDRTVVTLIIRRLQAALSASSVEQGRRSCLRSGRSSKPLETIVARLAILQLEEGQGEGIQ